MSSDINQVMAMLSLMSGDFYFILISTLQLLMSLDKMSGRIFTCHLIKVILSLLLSL